MASFRLSSWAAALALVTVLVPQQAGAAPRSGRAVSGEAQQAAQMISRYRQAQGLGPVTLDARLNAPARHQAETLAQLGTLSHGDFAGRMRSFGVKGTAAENLAYGSPDVGGAIAQWQGSSAHNANLLMPAASRIGLARVDNGVTRYWVLVLAQ